MADRSFLVVAAAIALMIGADIVLNNALASMFLIKKIIGLVDYLEFWR